jgi:hypothetical protein
MFLLDCDGRLLRSFFGPCFCRSPQRNSAKHGKRVNTQSENATSVSTQGLRVGILGVKEGTAGTVAAALFVHIDI